MSQPRLLSFTLDGWNALGGEVSVSLADRVAVLVGRNGAGKSAILEGFEAISSWATGRYRKVLISDSDSVPKILRVKIRTPDYRLLEYQYERIIISSADISDIDDSASETSEDSLFSWNDSCQYIDEKNEEDKKLLWRTDIGITILDINQDPKAIILGDKTSLRNPNLPKSYQLELPQEMQWVYNVLKGVRLLGKSPIRRTPIRIASSLKISSRGISSMSFSGLADTLSRKIFRLVDTEEFHELENICQRIGLGNKITVQKFISSENINSTNEGIEDDNEEYNVSILLDGINIGLLSDGTLRILSILIELISSHHSATTIIEEPETQIHPAMLEKLLNEIEAYTLDENLILSTHSPQVISWTSPEKINLVYREQQRTRVRKLQEGEIQKVVEYLCEEGDLGDWVYSGILDE
jgi:predicted ATP-dependent endonuclease of OLD family